MFEDTKSNYPPILDACCGGRMFWFHKKNPNVLYIDKRVVKTMVIGKGKDARKYSCIPDKIMDFTDLQIPDNTFKLIVFDPPHLVAPGPNSYMAQKYGRLKSKTWKAIIQKGFSECFRVLKTDGILIFKWNEIDIPLKDILSLCEYTPLFGHPSGKASKTHWVTFTKIDNMKKPCK